MKLKFLSVGSALALLVVATACTKTPAQPTSTSGSGTSSSASSTASVGGVTMVAPAPVSPVSVAQLPNVSQPITFVITNGITTGTTPVTYTIEVASDSGFANKVYTKDGVVQGANGQTSLTIDRIAAGQSYFWRVRINSGATPGPYSTARGFTIGPAIVLQAPVLGDPAPNTTVAPTPTLNVNNVQRTGPAGKIVYLFQVSDSPSFSNIVFSASTSERTDLTWTSLNVTTQLTVQKTYYWRVQASDATNSVTSPFSGVSSFTVVPPFDMRQARIYNSPSDLGSWPETSKITSVVFAQDAMLVDFDKRAGPDQWLDWPFGEGSLEYTLGMCVNINGHWDCSAVVQFWNGRELTASGYPWEVGTKWFYDPGRWGEMTGYQPANGEIVGFFASSGNERNQSFNLADCPRQCERTNVVFVPFTTNNDEAFTFSLAGTAKRLIGAAAQRLIRR